MKKVIVLNSGGFDSVVLMHLVHDMLGEECEIHSLHFSYRQNNFAQELVSSVEVAEKMNCVIHNVRLPMISWTKSNFFNPDFENSESQYLEYRNLIFLSYAMSLAESIGAEAIYLAILKSHHGYTDTSLAFIDHVNKMAKELSNIEILTPFIEMDK
jgi:7-cyano-7-deazaguanine synthase